MGGHRGGKAAHDKNGGRDIPSTDSLHDFIRRRAAEVVRGRREGTRVVGADERNVGPYVGEPVWKHGLRFAWMEECCGGGTSKYCSHAEPLGILVS